MASWRGTCGGIGPAVVLAVVVRAADAFAEAPADDAARDRRSIEEVVVTAQKREQSLRDVPLSVIAFDGESFREEAIDDLHELGDRAPNTRFPANPCCTTVFVRGLGTPFATSAFEPAVGLSVDGLSLPRDLFMAAPLYDLERLEVLRGPQGTFFGKNTSAGLFNVTTARPSAEPDGQVTGRAGNLGAYHLEGGAGGPLGDAARVRLAGVVARQPGDVHNTRLDDDAPGAGQRGGRLAIALTPVDDLEVLAIASGALTQSRFHGQLRSLDEDSLEFLREYDPAVEDDGFDHRNSLDLEEPIRQTTYTLQTNAGYELRGPGVRVDAVLGLAGVGLVQPLDLDNSPADLLHLVSPNEVGHRHLTAELRVSGVLPLPLVPAVEVTGGLFLMEAGFDSRSRLRAGEDFDAYLLSAPGFETVTGSPGAGFANLGAALTAFGVDPAGIDTLEGDGALLRLDQSTGTQALFGHVSWPLLPKWTLALGGRLTFERKRARLHNQCASPGFLCAALGIEEFSVVRRRRETDVSPLVSLRYAPFEELALFVTRTQGFKSGGFNRFGFTPDAVEVGSERAVSWEAGARGAIFGERLAYDAVLFHTEVDDLQLQSIAGGIVQVRNAASARSRGAEVDLEWLAPWRPMRVAARGALLDARFRRFPDAPAPAADDDTTQDLSGRPLPYAPEVHFVVSPGLRLPVTLPAGSWREAFPRRLALVAALDVVYRSEQFLDLDLDPATRQPGYALVHFRLGLAADDDAWSVGLALENLTDTDAYEFVTDAVLFPGGFSVLQELQRRYTFGLRAAW